MSMNAEQVVRTNVGTNQGVLTRKAATNAVVLQDFTSVDGIVMVINQTVIILFFRARERETIHAH